ncbi:MAG TPA: hypothetical protein VJ201_00475, partial [Candidatus Babeliales bacterium]|nr:hypothetical protein [Candidatus Babeliales bacterium]
MISKPNRYHYRLHFIIGLFFLCYCIIIVRFYMIQIQNQALFKQLAINQHHAKVTLKAERGIIYDRSESPLAINREVTSAFFSPQKLKDKTKPVEFIQKHFPLAWDQYCSNPQTQFIWLKRNLSEMQIHTLKEANLSDIHLIKEPYRYYQLPCISSLIGSTNIDNIGISGIELYAQNILEGSSTIIEIEHDARQGNRSFKTTIIQQGIPGNNITLSIDSTLQFIAAEELEKTITSFEALEGGVLIM